MRVNKTQISNLVFTMRSLYNTIFYTDDHRKLKNISTFQKLQHVFLYLP